MGKSGSSPIPVKEAPLLADDGLNRLVVSGSGGASQGG